MFGHQTVIGWLSYRYGQHTKQQRFVSVTLATRYLQDGYIDISEAYKTGRASLVQTLS